MKEIVSASNPQYKLFLKLLRAKKYRQQEGSYLAEGLNMLDIPKEQVLGYIIARSKADYSKEWGVDERKTIIMADALFKELSTDSATQGMIVWLKTGEHTWDKEVWKPKKNGLYLALEDIRDGGNLGTMIRTAEAAGVDAVFCSAGTVDLYHPKVIKSAASSLSRVQVYLDVEMPELLERMREHRHKTYATTPTKARAYTEVDYSGGAMFFIGNEAAGLQRQTMEAADSQVFIPMEGSTESLNAGISAAILLYEAKRQRDLR